MNTKEEILQFLKSNKLFLSEKFHLTKIGLFGSCARGEQNTNSDVDILIELEAGTTNIFDLEWDLKELLKKQFHADVDIVREKYVKSYFKPYILKDVIYVWLPLHTNMYQGISLIDDRLVINSNNVSIMRRN